MFKPKRLILCGVLTAIALTVFVIESQIPAFVPLPGVKLGLANIITLFALVYLSPRETLMILVARILLGTFLIGNPSVLIYSLLGGLGCFTTEFLLLKVCKTDRIWAISAVGAMTHNLIQLIVAALITQTGTVFWYLPPLMISGILTGLFTGFCILYLNFSIHDRIQKLL